MGVIFFVVRLGKTHGLAEGGMEGKNMERRGRGKEVVVCGAVRVVVWPRGLKRMYCVEGMLGLKEGGVAVTDRLVRWQRGSCRCR